MYWWWSFVKKGIVQPDGDGDDDATVRKGEGGYFDGSLTAGVIGALNQNKCYYFMCGF